MPRRYKRKRGTARKNYRKGILRAFESMRTNNETPYGDAFRAAYGETYQTADNAQRAARRAIGYYGAGDYRSALSSVGRWGSRAVGALGMGAAGLMGNGWEGAVQGAKNGWNAGAGFSKYMGWGDYSPQSGNDLIVGSGSQQAIQVNRAEGDASGDICLAHTEFLRNIEVTIPSSGSSAFTLVELPINVGLGSTFPFLSQIASNYTLYDLQGLIFQYKPTSGENGQAGNNAIGKIIMATQYDPDAPPFISSVQMENYAYSNSTKPSCGAIHGVETAFGKTSIDLLYVRTGNTTKAKNFTDTGTFYFASEGVPGTAGDKVQIGELWVTYMVRLSRPTIDNLIIGKNLESFYATWSGTTNDILFGSVTYDSTNTLDLTIARYDGNTISITWPVHVDYGDYNVWVQAEYGGADTGMSFSTASAFDGVLFWDDADSSLDPSGIEQPNPAVATSTTKHSIMVNVNVNTPGNSQAIIYLNQSATADNGAYTIRVNKINGSQRLAQ